MKPVWLTVALGLIGSLGCTATPKREMRQPTAEEFATPPPNMYTTPPDVPRDQPLLVPKTSTPALNPGPGMPGMGGPGIGPGGSPGGVRR